MPKVRQFALVEAALVVPADEGIDPAHREIHPGEPQGSVVALLSIDGNVANASAMLFAESLGLYKHAAGTAARIADSALVGVRNFNQQPDDGARCSELAPRLPSALAKPQRKNS